MLSWRLTRGFATGLWQCRMEGQARELSEASGPIIVLASTSSVSLLNPLEVTRAPIGDGNFTCCRLGHRLPDDNGGFFTIPCDKHRVVPPVKAMIAAKLKALRAEARLRPGGRARDEALEQLRWLLARRSSLCHGLPGEDIGDFLPRRGEQTMQAFLDEYGFSGVGDGHATGLGPLRFAAAEGEAGLVQQLLRCGCPFDARLKRPAPAIFHAKGCTALHTAAFFGHVQVCVALDHSPPSTLR